jgi:hypothetical protein
VEGTAVFPYVSGEIARLRADELAREAAAHRHPPIPRPASRLAGSPAAVRLRARLRSADAGARQAVGLRLIRAGLRIVEPAAAADRTSTA